jgi:Fe-S-cluster-containing dehydrogenase component
MGPSAVRVSVVGLRRSTMTAVVMAIMNVTEITDRQTDRLCVLKYSHCQEPSCVQVCQFHGLSLYLTDSAVTFTR